MTEFFHCLKCEIVVHLENSSDQSLVESSLSELNVKIFKVDGHSSDDASKQEVEAQMIRQLSFVSYMFGRTSLEGASLGDIPRLISEM